MYLCTKSRYENVFIRHKSRCENVGICIKGQCTPVECKATTGNAKSMRTVLSHPEKYHVTNAIKFGDYNIGRKDQLLTLPMYMAFLLKEV